MQAAEWNAASRSYRLLANVAGQGAPTAKIHPSSCLNGQTPSVVVYSTLMHTSQSYIRDLTVVSWDLLTAAAPSGYFDGRKVKVKR